MLNQLRRSAYEKLQGNFFYGWVILVVAMLAMFGTGPGQSHLIGIFFDSLSEDLELPRTSIAAAYGSATLVAAFLLPQVGKLIDRFGAASLMWVLVVCLGLAAMFFSMAFNWVFIAVGFGFLRFVGQGSMMMTCANLVSQWFDKKRGMALGLMSLGFPISMAIHPPLAQWMINQVGWRESWIWLGVATWALLLPPVVIFLFSKPEELGLNPDGEVNEDTGSGPLVITGMTLSEALRTPAFYILCCGLFSFSMLVTSLHVENKGILTRHGLDPQTATLMFTVSGIMAALSMPIIGRMLDRFRSNWMFAGGLLVMSTSLISVTFVEGVYSAMLYATVFGINNGITMTFFSFFWPRFFGRKHLGSIQGTSQMIMVVGASIGPLPLAIASDYTGDYDLTLRFLALLPATFSIAALFLRQPSQMEGS